jgi:transcriptional regulator with XRE-family HTH domain
MNIGTTIKDIRKKRSLKQLELAKITGVSQTYLSQIESGSKKPTLDILEKISNALNIPFPVLSYLSISEEQVADEKKGRFKEMEPVLKGIIEGIFLND